MAEKAIMPQALPGSVLFLTHSLMGLRSAVLYDMPVAEASTRQEALFLEIAQKYSVAFTQDIDAFRK